MYEQLAYFTADLSLRRVRPEMIGCIIDNTGTVLHVGTSQNYPHVPINRKAFVEAYQARRKEFVGERLWDYDTFIQQRINADEEQPASNLPYEHIVTRDELTGHRWAVFRGGRDWYITNPFHYEPRCYA